MKITPKNILRHELIGLTVEVHRSRNKYLEGIKGVVVDETMKMLVIETERGRKMVQKSVCDFIFTLPDGTKVLVEGKYLVGRPEDRLKKKIRTW